MSKNMVKHDSQINVHKLNLTKQLHNRKTRRKRFPKQFHESALYPQNKFIITQTLSGRVVSAGRSGPWGPWAIYSQYVQAEWLYVRYTATTAPSVHISSHSSCLQRITNDWQLAPSALPSASSSWSGPAKLKSMT
jgi:hypothetical protein